MEEDIDLEKLIGKRGLQLIESMDEGVLLTDMDGIILKANKAFEGMTGYKEEDVLGKDSRELAKELIIKDHLDRALKILEEKTLEGKSEKAMDVQIESKEGKRKWISLKSSFIEDEKGRPLNLAIARDITEMKNVSDALESNRKKYRSFLELCPDGIAVHRKGRLEYINSAGAEMLGMEDREKHIGESILNVVHPDSRDTVKQRVQKMFEKGEEVPLIEEKFVRLDDGEPIDVEVAASPVEVDEEPMIQVVFRDISERKEKERELKTLLSNLPGMAYRCLNNKDWTMRFVSEGCEELTGYEPEELIDDREVAYGHLIVPEHREQVWEDIQEGVDSEEPFRITYKIKTSEGKTRWVWEQGRGVFSEEGELKFLEGFICDITERKKAKEKVDHLNNLLRSIRQINQLITKEDDLEELMEKSRELLMNTRGYSDVSIFLTENNEIKKKFGEYPKIDGLEDRIRKLKKKNKTISYTESEHTFWLVPIVDKIFEGFLVVKISEDIDDEEIGLLEEIAGDLGLAKNKIKAEARLRKSLEEKEVLLDEIHHRVKNNLQVISSMLKLQASDKGEEDPSALLDDAQNRIRSMALIHEMLHRSDDVARIDLSGYLDELIRSIYQTYDVGYDEIQLVTDFEPIQLGIDQATPCVQVVNEMVSNSLRHAFPKVYEGQCRLEVKTDKECARVEIEVSDNGVGIPDEVDLEDPETFGLRLIRMLVEDQLDGWVEMQTQKGEGTTFRMSFEKEELEDD